MRSSSTTFFRLILPILVIFFITACQSTPAPSSTPQPTTTNTTPEPTRTSTPAPLGSSGNPIIIGVVPDTLDQNAEQASQAVAAKLSLDTKLVVQSKTFTSYPLLLADLKQKKIHFAWLPPFTYLWAKQNGWAEAAALSNHFGVYEYGTQFIANALSNFTLYFDPKANTNVTDSATALKQLNDKRPCWVDPQSASGYIVPLSILQQNEYTPKPGIFILSNVSVVRALYITGICDFGVTFSTLGDPRTSQAVLQDLPDALNRVVILWRSDPIIPTLNFSYRTDIPNSIRQSVILSLIDYGHTADGKNNLSKSTAYDIQDLKPVADEVYDPLRQAIEQTGSSLENLVGK